MIRVNDNYSLFRLFYDVHWVLQEASKEFKRIDYRFDFDSKSRGVKCVRFFFEFRKSYYVNTYPYSVELFSYLDCMKRNAFSGFAYVRHSVDIFCKDGAKKYSLVLWY